MCLHNSKVRIYKYCLHHLTWDFCWLKQQQYRYRFMTPYKYITQETMSTNLQECVQARRNNLPTKQFH